MIFPPAVDSHTFVRVQFSSGECVPVGHFAISGSTITLTSSLRPGFSCIEVPPTVATANVGVLAPGIYELVAGSDHSTLIVRDAESGILVSPVGAAIDRRRTVDVFSDRPFDPPVTVLFDGVAGDVVNPGSGDRLVVTPPPHAAGTVNVVVTDRIGTRTSVAAFTYFDPAAPADPQTLEPVLFPIGYDGPGVFGSQWATQNLIGSGNPLVRFRQPVPVKYCEGSCDTQFNWSAALAEESNSGVLLWVVRRRLPAGVDDEFRVSSRIAETSRASSGTSLPVAREGDFHDTFTIDDVAIGGSARATLRVYSLRETQQTANVVVRFANGSSVTHHVTLVPVNGVAFAAVNLTPPAGVPRAGVADITIGGRKVWGMVTVTDNATQEVTAFWPQ